MSGWRGYCQGVTDDSFPDDAAGLVDRLVDSWANAVAATIDPCRPLLERTDADPDAVVAACEEVREHLHIALEAVEHLADRATFRISGTRDGLMDAMVTISRLGRATAAGQPEMREVYTDWLAVTRSMMATLRGLHADSREAEAHRGFFADGPMRIPDSLGERDLLG